MARVIIALLALVLLPRVVVAQQSGAYTGGTVNLVTVPHADDQPLGGTTLGGSALVGVRVSDGVAIEFEPTFQRSFASEYTYRPAPSLVATVVPSRRDAFFPVQVRIGHKAIEPVVGVGIVHGTIARHATIGDATYFDDSRSRNDLAVLGGFDAAIKVASRLYLVPTFRVRLTSHWSNPMGDPLDEQTSTGPFTFRYGVGARVEF